MRIPGYKLVILVLSVIIVFLILHQLGYSYERSGLTASWLLGATTPLDVINKTENESEGQNKSLYYSALPGTDNNWTLFDIRRRANIKRLELIGLRLIIVDKIQVHPMSFFIISYFIVFSAITRGVN